MKRFNHKRAKAMSFRSFFNNRLYGGVIMSVVVVLKDKDKMLVGVDTRMSSDSGLYHDSYKARPKAIHFDEEKTVIGGMVGNGNLLEVLRIIYDKHKKDRDSIDRKYIVKYFIPELITACSKRNLLVGKERHLEGSLVLLIKDRGYMIASNFNVSEIMDYEAMGCGDKAVLASLYTSKDYLINPVSRIVKAIKATAYVDNRISSTVYIGSTAGEQFESKQT